MKLRVHAVSPRSAANGPGRRFVVWVQGCSLGCPGCFNPQTHAPQAGREIDVEILFHNIVEQEDSIEGVTVSGGEPLEQLEAVTALLELVRRHTRLSSILFTGYSWRELTASSDESFANRVRWGALLDVMMAGRYVNSLRKAQRLIGSDNKTVHFFSQRYSAADFNDVAPAEVWIGADGSLSLSGIDPLRVGR